VADFSAAIGQTVHPNLNKLFIPMKIKMATTKNIFLRKRQHVH